MTARLFTASERGLATLRIKAFRHVHDLPLLTQNTERRGALVSRVTSDVDQVSQFLVFGGILVVVSVGQIGVATVVMLFYSWQLTIVVWVCFLPLFLSLRYFQRRLSDAYGIVRRQVGVMLSADLRARRRRGGRPHLRHREAHPGAHRRRDPGNQVASTRAQGLTAFSFSLGGLSGGLANAGVLIVGIWLGFAGQITAGEVIAFAFLVSPCSSMPVQMGTQVLTDAQNAIAGWRRVIGILETPADLDDPGPDGQVLPRGPIDVEFDARHLRLPRRSRRAARRRPAHRVRHPHRRRRRDRLRQDHLRQAADPADGPDDGRGAARRRRPARDRAVLAAPVASYWCPRRVSCSTTRCWPTPATATSRRPTRRSSPRPPSSGSATGSTGCPAGWTPGSASAASRCRRGSGSWSRCCAPTWPTPTCWSSTRPPARSTPPWRCGSAGPSNG